MANRLRDSMNGIAKNQAEKVAFHASGPLLRKLIAQQKHDESAGKSGGLGMVAKRLLLQTGYSEPTDSVTEIQQCREQIEHLKLTVDTLRLELRTVVQECSPELLRPAIEDLREVVANTIRPVLQELRDDVATAVHAVLVLVAQVDKTTADKVVESAFPRQKSIEMEVA